MKRIVNHYEGDPNGCSDECSRNNSHIGDAPDGFVCPDCGGGAQCFPECLEPQRNRRFEPHEGLTGAQEFFDTDSSFITYPRY